MPPRSVGEVNLSVEQLDRTTRQNVAMIEETAQANRELKDMAGQLWDAMVIFQANPAPMLRAG